MQMDKLEKQIELVNKNNMKILKIIMLISYLSIMGLGQHGIPVFALLFIYIYQFIHDIISHSKNLEIFWEGGVIFIVNLFIFIIILYCRPYKDKYVLLLGVFSLFILTLYLSGLFYQHNYEKITLHFLVPLIVFVGTASILIIKNFKNPVKISRKYDFFV